MRYALPIWHCLDLDTQVKLAPLLHDAHSIPPPVWQEWPHSLASGEDIPIAGQLEVNYDKFMRQAPSKSRGYYRS